jgi:cytochrome c peroxidase
MWIIRVALNRPYTFIVLALLILLLSPVIILTAPTDMFPHIDIPVVAVGWVYTGLSPQELSSDVLITPAVQKEIDDITGRIDNTEAEALAQLKAKRLDRSEQITLLGKLIYFDKNLSVNRNEACTFCHMPEAAFTGGVNALNATTGSYPGSVRTRFSDRKPMSHTYATYAPTLHYNQNQGDFVGGNFWDMRATGLRLNNPSAEQAQGPPVNPVEMALPDSACVVYRLSQRPYRVLAETVWGPQAFVIHWPTNVERVCSSPGPAPISDPLPVRLSPVDRGSSNRTFDQFAEAIATFESSTEVNPFTSKYDYVLAGKADFTAEEKAGYALFRSSTTHCNECHRDGGPGEEPLFTDFTASNLGVPRNPDLPFYKENTPDQFGYTANPLGAGFVDLGVGGFLRHHLQLSAEQNPNSQWEKLASSFAGKFKVPTLRNVDMRPRPDFVKAYMHNGYFKSLKEVVHFYNTRDVLPRCRPNDPGERVSCWPAPEYLQNENKRQLGNLHLTDQQEYQIAAFMRTLTDGYVPHKK